MNSLIGLAKKLRDVFNHFADEPGKSTGFIKRSRKLTGSALVKMLVLARQIGGHSRKSGRCGNEPWYQDE